MAKVKDEKRIEEALWESANKLRGSVEPSEYKHVVLSLIFLKYASDRFEEKRKAIISSGRDRFSENVAFYTADNIFYLPPESRWTFIMENASKTTLRSKLILHFLI